ncbi:MAG: TMEM43 family protein, partial [Verrucomicrobiota bacterium]|nr:TMEM43 family protein [Verrucomicrobiota bacterium]
VQSGAVEKANEGKLVHVSGMATSQETLADPRFETISVTNSLKLERRVEMYQWKETRNDSGTEYDEVWSQKVIDSSKFRKAGHDNPGSMPVKGWKKYARNPKLDDFKITKSLINKMGNGQEITPKTTVGLEGSRIVGNELYHGSNPSYKGGVFNSADIGDIRISFHVHRPGEITVIAKQSGDTLNAYTTSNGETLELVANGRVRAEKMFGHARTLKSIMTWFVRFIIWVFLFVIICITFRLSSELINTIPLLGDLAKWGTILFSLVMAFSISALVISLTWISYRPLTSTPLLLCAIAFVILPRFINKKNHHTRSPEVTTSRLPPVIQNAATPTLPPVLPVTSNETTESTTAGELSHLSPQLLGVLEECTIYLAALDNKFTPIEQTWVNTKFGAGAVDRFTAQITAADKENPLKVIGEKLCQLNPEDQSYIKTQASALFQNLMESDGLEGIEQEKLIGLMRFIRESLEKA